MTSVTEAFIKALAPVTRAGARNVTPNRYSQYLMVRRAVARVLSETGRAS